MRPADRFTPRALLLRTMVNVDLTSFELSTLIAALETRASEASEKYDQIDFSDYLFRRIAELREAFR